ncbi:MAG: diaminopimelate decarboxylase [Rectinemataceae bacterium]
MLNDFLEDRGGLLHFDGCDLVALAREHGTPLYLMSGSSIRARLSELRLSFLDRHGNVAAAYASKAFQTLDILGLMRDEGLCLDVVSGGELFAAAKVGFPMERVFFHGNAKTGAELAMAVGLGVGRIVVDNPSELQALDSIARAQGRVQPILFRVTPGVDSHTHQKISTGTIDSKFGIPLDRSLRDGYIKAALGMGGVALKGFHFHIGSQLFDRGSHLLAIGIALDLLAECRRDYGYVAEDLNIGGGFGVRYTESDHPPPLAYFTDAMMEAIDSGCAGRGLSCPRVIIEPGRWMVAEAGVTLYTVTSVKDIPGQKRWIGVDGGMTDNIRPSMYEARYEALLANKAGSPRSQTVDIAGRCCESGDVLIRNIALPPVETGDILAVFTTGAYHHTMASNYNRVPRPALLSLREGTARLSVRRETYEDLIAREAFP